MYCMQNTRKLSSNLWVFCRADAKKFRIRSPLFAKIGKINSESSAYSAIVSLDFLAFILQKSQAEYNSFACQSQVLWKSGLVSGFTDVLSRIVSYFLPCSTSPFTALCEAPLKYPAWCSYIKFEGHIETSIQVRLGSIRE